MTDKEMQELAAKAAGIELACWDEERQFWIRMKDDPEKVRQNNKWGSVVFDPLYDDGVAFRLAVGLRIDIGWSHLQYATAMHMPLTAGETIRVEEHGEDPFATTRRAIVRAAAAIGSTL